MFLLNTVISKDENDTKNSETNTKQSASNMVAAAMDADYDLGLDVGQKVLYLIIMLGAIILPSQFTAAWFLASSIFGYFLIVSVIGSLLDKKSKELLQKENAKRFMGMSSRVWNSIVAISLLTFLIIGFFEKFYYTNLIAYPIAFIICYGILTKKATASMKDPDPKRVGSPAWKEANEVVRVPGYYGQWRLYRDKNGNYYENRLGQYVPIPAPVNIKDKK